MRRRPAGGIRGSASDRELSRLLDQRGTAGGGGGIRTPGAFALRFSRPSPSTTRPLLRGFRFPATYACADVLVNSAAGAASPATRWLACNCPRSDRAGSCLQRAANDREWSGIDTG